jgi:ATP-binding cassette, subfamily C (CFTR/MRP), member 4
VYVLDDPLSAVDAHVGKALMTDCIKGVLRGRNKAVILVTHQLQYLKYADKVLVLDKSGKQSFYGDYLGLTENRQIMDTLELNPLNAVDDESLSVDTSSRSVPLTSSKLLELKPLPPTGDGRIETEEDAKRRRIIEVEDRQTGEISWNVYWQYIKSGGVLRCILIILFNLASQGLLMITDYWLRWWASESFGSQDNILYVWIFAILVFLCIIVGFIRALAWFRFALFASSNLHQQCLWAVFHSPLLFFVANPTGRILNRFAKDQNLVDETLPTYFFMFLEGSVFCLASVILVCISIPWLLLLLPFIGIAFVLMRKKYMASTREIKRIEAVTRSPIYSDFSATLDGLLTLRAYCLEDKAKYLFQNQLDDNGQAYFSFLMCARWLGFRLDMESAVVLIVVAFLSVILRKQVDVGLIGFALVYTMALSGLFQWVVRVSVEVESQMTSVERISAYASLPPEAGYETTLESMTSASSTNALAKRKHKDDDNWASTLKGNVELRNLTVKYRNDLDPVLRDISVTMKARTKIGVCGRTGSGKSSTLLALLRLNIITEGDILIDDRSILKMSLENARGLISIIPQEPHLFSGSIRFNLDPFSAYSDIQIWDALRDAHIRDYIAQDPSGLQMNVEESGKNFSVGQRQLLSLARAILRRSKVVLMDEVTASIDFQTDRLIQETIRTSPALRDSTIITVAHRLRTIADSDMIIVVDAGRVVEMNSPSVLLNTVNSNYKRLAEESGEYDEIYRLGSNIS